MSIDLAYDDSQQGVADAVAQFCAQRYSDEQAKSAPGRLPDGLWSELAEMGVLATASAEGVGGALEIVAAMESLGRAVFPGPLAATFLAGQLLTGDRLRSVTEGRALVAAGRPPFVPWASEAEIFFELDGAQVFHAEPRGAVQAAASLGGDPVGRVVLKRGAAIPNAASALSLSDAALAAYLAAAGERLVADAAEHARSRKQFGRAIGEFQAVAHPLADCSVKLAAASTLARAAAFHFDHKAADAARTTACAARLSARGAALDAVHVCHQVFGAIGITLEGAVFQVSRRIRQLAAWPGEASAREVVLARFEGKGGAV